MVNILFNLFKVNVHKISWFRLWQLLFVVFDSFLGEINPEHQSERNPKNYGSFYFNEFPDFLQKIHSTQFGKEGGEQFYEDGRARKSYSDNVPASEDRVK